MDIIIFFPQIELKVSLNNNMITAMQEPLIVYSKTSTIFYSTTKNNSRLGGAAH
jgi:hypothetical protein